MANAFCDQADDLATGHPRKSAADSTDVQLPVLDVVQDGRHLPWKMPLRQFARAVRPSASWAGLLSNFGRGYWLTAVARTTTGATTTGGEITGAGAGGAATRVL